MHPPKTLSWIVLLAILPQLTGCFSHRVRPDPRPGVYSEVRVTKERGERVTPIQVRIDSLKIAGREKSDRERVQLLRGEAELIEVQAFSLLRTVGFVS